MEPGDASERKNSFILQEAYDEATLPGADLEAISENVSGVAKRLQEEGQESMQIKLTMVNLKLEKAIGIQALQRKGESAAREEASVVRSVREALVASDDVADALENPSQAKPS